MLLCVPIAQFKSEAQPTPRGTLYYSKNSAVAGKLWRMFRKYTPPFQADTK